jgi:hypothetical protein
MDGPLGPDLPEERDEMESFADAKQELWHNRTEYRWICPMLEYIYSTLFTLEENGVDVSESVKAIEELDEYLYERLDV